MLKPATVFQLKQELQHKSQDELLQLCLRLSKFKKENKELLTYLLFSANDESSYIISIQEWVEQQFEIVNTSSVFYSKKTIRKVLRELKKHIRISQRKETEIELLLHFCKQLKTFHSSFSRSRLLQNIYSRQLELVQKKIKLVDEDLQYDYGVQVEELMIS